MLGDEGRVVERRREVGEDRGMVTAKSVSCFLLAYKMVTSNIIPWIWLNLTELVQGVPLIVLDLLPTADPTGKIKRPRPPVCLLGRRSHEMGGWTSCKLFTPLAILPVDGAASSLIRWATLTGMLV
jgi:hypothetical protein